MQPIRELTLAALGLTEGEERAYRALLRRNELTAAGLALATGLSRGELRKALAGLETKGFASRTTGRGSRFIPAPPDVAIEASIHRQQERLEQARLFGLRLLDEFKAATRVIDPVEVIEVVLGRDARLQRFAQLQQVATEELIAFNKPPYAQAPSLTNVEEDVALKKGVLYRVVYAQAALEYPGMLPHIEHYVAAGEEARVFPDLPMKLTIADRKLALVPLSVYELDAVDMALLIHASPLLEALAVLFETLWERAIPIHSVGMGNGAAERSRSPEEERLLALLASGLKDQAIARHLGVGLRTVHRRVASLMGTLDAQTRYQAGLQAARRGWH